MKQGTKHLLTFCVALVMVAASMLLAGRSLISSRAQTSLASSISNITEFSVPGSDPWGTAFDSNGRVWVALPGCDFAPSCPAGTPPGKLALFDPVSQSWVTVVSLPSGYGQPIFVAVDHNGKVWFTMPVTNALGMYDPAAATVSQWAVPTAGAGPWGITIDSGGKIWFTEHYVNQIASFDPGSQTFHEIATPATNSNPYGITVDSSNNIWFTENTDAVALIGEYTSQGVLKEYKIRNTPTGGTGLTPHLITVDQNSNIWWSEGWVSAIGMLNVAAAQPGTNNGVTEYFYTPSCSSCGSHTSGISADRQGLIWLDDSLQNTFGSFPIGGGSFTFYNSPSGGHPHDGLNVDAQNRVWYDEEFANKLAEAIQGPSTPTPTPTSSSPTATPTTSTPTPTSTPGSTLGTDTFQRPNRSLWGTASDGQTWGGDANTQPAFSISGNTGLVTNTGGNSYSAVLGPSATNAEVFASGSISSFTNSNFGDVLRWTNGNNWYKAYIDGTSLIIQKKVNGSTTILASVPFSAAAGTSYTIHFRAVGLTLTANAWASSGSEPPGWMATTSDSSLTSGFSGMRFLTQGGTATVTSFLADVPGGSGTPTPTPSPTNAASPTPTNTTTPTPTPTNTTTTTTTPSPTNTTTPSPTPTTGTPLGTDTFQRPNQSLWGTASDGQTWGGDANIQKQFSISNHSALVSKTGGNSYSAVLGPSATNAEVFASGSISSFTNSNFGDVLRWTNGNNWYKAFIDGTSLIIQKKVNGTTTILASVPFKAVAGTSYTIHFRVVGSTLTANVWASSGSEPPGWMATVSDSSLTSGFCGMRFLTQSGTATITSFQALSV